MDERKSQWELFLEEEENPAPKEKRCSKCRAYKSTTEFFRNRTKKDGLDCYCKDCCSDKKYKSRVDRFWKYYWSRVKQVGECMEWQGGYSNKTTPVCCWDYKQYNVRRLIYRLALGDLSDDTYVVPTCKNKRCVRHSHLELSTKELLEAKLFDGRRPTGDRHGSRTRPDCVLKGESAPRVRLTEKSVVRIRTLRREGVTGRSLAQMYGVTETCISAIIHRKTWKHVQ